MRMRDTVAGKLILGQMMDKVISEYGFEAEETIRFCQMVEDDKPETDKVFTEAVANEFMKLVG